MVHPDPELWRWLPIQRVSSTTQGLLIREIPDHVNFRGKGVNTGLVRQTVGMSLFGPM